MIRENQRIFNTVLILADALVCVVSVVLAYLLRFFSLSGSGRVELAVYLRAMVWIVPIQFLIYHYFRLHDAYRSKSMSDEAERIVRAGTLCVALVFVLFYFLREINVSRAVILLWGVINITLSCAGRLSARRLLRYLRKKGYNLKTLLLVGFNESTKAFYEKITSNRELGFRVSGYLRDAPSALAPPRARYLGRFADLPAILEANGIDEAVISLNYDEFWRMGSLIEACEKAGVKSTLLPFYNKYLPMRPRIDEIEGIPLINLRSIPLDNIFNRFVKRSVDIAGALAGLILLSPVMLVTAVGVRLTSPGPVIYRQVRMGRNKKDFTMYKFRSMRTDDNNDATTWGTSNDSRRTRFGVFIRKCSIDELPQLFNVLKGDMSLVGPRPERPYFVDILREEVPLYMLKHLVRPGITGWAQINGWRGDTSIVQRVKCDIFYIENWSLLLDVKILLKTVFDRRFINSQEEM